MQATEKWRFKDEIIGQFARITEPRLDTAPFSSRQWFVQRIEDACFFNSSSVFVSFALHAREKSAELIVSKSSHAGVVIQVDPPAHSNKPQRRRQAERRIYGTW